MFQFPFIFCPPPRTLRFGAVLAVCLLSLFQHSTALAQVDVTIRFAPGVISFPNQDRGFGADFEASIDDAVAGEGYALLLRTLESGGAATFRPVAPHFRHLPDRNYDHFGNEVELVDMTDDYTVRFTGVGVDAETLCEVLTDLSGIVIAEPQPQAEYFFSPNDDYFDLQWYLDNTGQDIGSILSGCSSDTVEHCISGYDIGAPAGWDSVLVPGTKIALLDTGVLSTHEDLANSLDFRTATGDNCGHGTSLTGMLAGAGNNSQGIASVARPNYLQADSVLIVMDTDSNCYASGDAANAALATLANDNDYYPDFLVANESWGGPYRKWSYPTTWRDARRNAYVKGITLTAASGNAAPWCNDAYQDSCYIFPAAFDYFTLAVTGMDCRGNQKGVDLPYVDLAAPSQKFVTTDEDTSGDDYEGIETDANCGTSFSAPLVAGVAAMLLGADSNLEPDDIGAILRKTAADISGLSNGHGLVQLDAAVQYVSSPKKVYHGSTSSYTGTYVESRYQEFKNVPGANSQSEQWQTFWVKVYRIDATAAFTCPRQGETAVDAWPRRRLSTGFPNEDKIDRLLLTGYLEVVPGSIDSSGCDLRTYTYKVYSDSTEQTCLVWYPLVVSGQGSCLSLGSNAKFDYTYVGTVGGGSFAGDLPSIFSRLRARRTPEGIVLTADGISPAGAEFEIYDVTGRRVWSSGVLRGNDGGWARVLWDRTANGQTVAQGIYFARVRSNGTVLSKKKILVIE